ncbi:hypothetical protein Scep_012507 [Stephania cephalantha]|uniref:BTB/POZ domain-containing protein n=1 Tax=Stephania cephalantha TaxID=152367 RepID=A0AAP0JFE1_9MAGN
MEAAPASPKVTSLALSPYSSPNVSALLKIQILAWSRETSLPVSVRVRICNKVLELHKYPLLSRSGYFRKALNEKKEIQLPDNFPGGAEVFEMVALFSYGSSTLIDPFNVAALRCAAEFLEMTEAYGLGNLCERSDLYLNQVVLQNWDDTLIVLQKCQSLLPLSEELLIVSRCVESLAFMACMEILDPEGRRNRPVLTVKAFASEALSCDAGKEIAGQEVWVKDLVALPFGFFKRIIVSLRRQGMKEKYVSPIIVCYANKWVLYKKTHQFWEHADEKINSDHANTKISTLLQGILDLLPTEEKASKVTPVGFYLALLSKAITLDIRSDSKTKLQGLIASMLHLASVDDLLYPGIEKEYISSSVQFSTMETIVSMCISSSIDTDNTPSDKMSIVAELWDKYLSNVAFDTTMSVEKFMNLIEHIPISYRRTHDHLYRAINTYLVGHPNISQEEKGSVCKYLNCQKLSQEAGIEAVQNDLMPLRLIVQALFVQQLNTHQVFKDCSDSFRYAHQEDFSGILSSSRHSNPRSQILETPVKEIDGDVCLTPMDYLPQKDIAAQTPGFSKEDYESTSFRIQNLEKELVALKRTLQLRKSANGSEQKPKKQWSQRCYSSEARTLTKKRNTIGQFTSSITSICFASQRKYASSLLKAFSRMTLFGKSKSKRKPGAAAQKSKPF